MSEEGVQSPAAPLPKAKKHPKKLAVIDQAGCRGCEVCIEFCHVDCILTVPGPEYDQHKKYTFSFLAALWLELLIARLKHHPSTFHYDTAWNRLLLSCQLKISKPC